MIKKLKVVLVLLVLLLTTACFGNMTPSERVEEMMSRYIKNDKDIVEELDSYLERQDLSDENEERYKKIVLDEYATIQYTIKDEQIDGDEATVEVAIEVKDLYKASNEAGKYLMDNPKEFYSDNKYDEEKFIDYKLKLMENTKDTVEYTIYVNLKKEDGIWSIEQLDEDTLEKIHGIYDYDSDSTEEKQE